MNMTFTPNTIYGDRQNRYSAHTPIPRKPKKQTGMGETARLIHLQPNIRAFFRLLLRSRFPNARRIEAPLLTYSQTTPSPGIKSP